MITNQRISFVVAVLLSCFAQQIICWTQDSSPVNFDCPKLPPLTQPARNVYELRPQDIKVVMALGDSITAGFAVMGRQETIDDDLLEYRGLSWSIGMDKGAQTLPNFLKNYRDDIVGGSVGNHTAETCYDIYCPPHQYTPEQDQLNAAQSGAMIPNLVKHEWNYMLQQLHDHPKIDIENDWKVLTLLIGANDLCLACSGDIPNLTPADFEYHLREVLDEIMKMPKVFVNLVLVGNISGVYELSLKSKYCVDVHRVLSIECVCAFTKGKAGDQLRQKLDKQCQNFNNIMKQVATEYIGRKDDFAVVIQPFFYKTVPDNFSVGFLSSLDCFHPSLLAHQLLAKALWNNMLTPAAMKKAYLDSNDAFICPTPDTLLYTY